MKSFQKSQIKIFLLENIIKNILILTILFILWEPIEIEIMKIKNEEVVKTILLFVGLIVIAPLFGVYGFSYQHTNFKIFHERFLSHLTTALPMLVSFILFKMIDVLFVRLVSENSYIFRGTLILFYISVVLYDFWDLLRFWKNDK